MFLKNLCIGLVLLNFVSFFWSVIGVFSKKEDSKVLKYKMLQIFTILTWTVNLYNVFTVNLVNFVYVVEIFVLTICLVVFWIHSRIVKINSFSIVYSNDTPVKLIKEGLYKYIRNPFYSTYLLCYLSLSVAYLSLPSFLLSVVMFLIYRDAAKFEEHKFLSSNLSIEYKEYFMSTGMFLPKIIKATSKKTTV